MCVVCFFWGVSPAQCTIYTLPYLPTCTYYPSDHVDKTTSPKEGVELSNLIQKASRLV